MGDKKKDKKKEKKSKKEKKKEKKKIVVEDSSEEFESDVSELSPSPTPSSKTKMKQPKTPTSASRKKSKKTKASSSSQPSAPPLVAASSPSKQKNKKKDGNTAEEYTDDPLISMAIVAYLRKHKYDRRLALVFGKEVIDRHGDSVMTVLDENNNKGGQLQFVRPHQTVADKKELETNKLTLSPTKNHKKTIKNNNDDGDESEGD